MFCLMASFAMLLWRLRKESQALYLFGAGASAPIVPQAPALLIGTSGSYVHLGSFPMDIALRPF